MNPSALRIGNFIRQSEAIYKVVSLNEQDIEAIPLKVTNDGPKGILFTSLKGPYFDGIILSPELLEKCGFLIDHAGNASIGDYVLRAVSNGYEFEGRTVIKSLHMLQNHYFFTEGSELPVNL